MVVSSDAACTASWGRADHDRRDVLRRRCRRPAPAPASATPARRCSLSTPQGDRLLGTVSSFAGCPDATLPTTFARLTANPLRAFLASPESVAVPEQITETTIHGQPWVGGADPLRSGPLGEQDPRPLQLRLVPRSRGAAQRDEGAASPDDRRPRHPGDVRRDRRERRRRQLRRRRPPDRRPGPARHRHDRAARPQSARDACRANTCTVRVRATDRSGIRRVELGVRSIRGVRLLTMSRRGKSFVASLPRREHELLVIATDNKRQRVEAVPADAVDGGQPARARHPRIIGGTAATAADYPFIGALIAHGVDPGAGQSCTGTLIAPDAVPDGGALRRRHPRVRLGRAARADRPVRHRRPAHPGHQPVVEPGLHRRAARLRRRPRAPRPRPAGARGARWR